MNRKLKTTAIAIVISIIGLATAAFTLIGGNDKPMTVTAQFEDAVGLYEGNQVSVLGMPVGKVTSIVPKDTYVQVTLNIDKGTDIPADAQAVTINTSLLTDRHIELTPVYRGGPKMKNGDVVSLAHTRTPVEFDRTLAEIDRLSRALAGDHKGNGPLADFIAIGNATTSGNGTNIKATLDKLSQALRLGNDNGAHTAADIQSIVTNLSVLTQSAAENDSAIREFGSNLRQVSDILADEQIGTGNTGKNINQMLANAAELLEKNRDKLKGIVTDSQTSTATLVDKQRELAETFDLLPLVADNGYNAIDSNAGAFRVSIMIDKAILDSGLTKELCNLMNRKQLGCATGTIKDFGPDFGLGMMLDLMGAGSP